MRRCREYFSLLLLIGLRLPTTKILIYLYMCTKLRSKTLISNWPHLQMKQYFMRNYSVDALETSSKGKKVKQHCLFLMTSILWSTQTLAKPRRRFVWVNIKERYCNLQQAKTDWTLPTGKNLRKNGRVFVPMRPLQNIDQLTFGHCSPWEIRLNITYVNLTQELISRWLILNDLCLFALYTRLSQCSVTQAIWRNLLSNQLQPMLSLCM